MASSRPELPTDRLAIGQILVRLLHEFRTELFSDPGRVRYPGLRFPHMQVWGNVGVDGVRLTDLADNANLSLAACSELVKELEVLGYLERRPHPTHGRAKLIFPTNQGRKLLDEAGQVVAALEARWRALCAPGDFDRACVTLDGLLSALVDDARGDGAASVR